MKKKQHNVSIHQAEQYQCEILNPFQTTLAHQGKSAEDDKRRHVSSHKHKSLTLKEKTTNCQP
jgi:hypothetical protein